MCAIAEQSMGVPKWAKKFEILLYPKCVHPLLRFTTMIFSSTPFCQADVKPEAGGHGKPC